MCAMHVKPPHTLTSSRVSDVKTPRARHGPGGDRVLASQSNSWGADVSQLLFRSKAVAKTSYLWRFIRPFES